MLSNHCSLAEAVSAALLWAGCALPVVTACVRAEAAMQTAWAMLRRGTSLLPPWPLSLARAYPCFHRHCLS